MRRSSEPEERAQFTVAELLARYGEPAPTPGRRRRRAADEPGPVAETAVPPIAHPNRAGQRESKSRPSASLLAPDVPSTPGAPPTPGGPSIPGGLSTPGGPATQPNRNGRTTRSWTPAVGPPPAAGQRTPAPPPVVARRAPLTGAAALDGPVTDQLPRYAPSTAGSSHRPTSAQPVNAPPVSTQPVKIGGAGAQAPAGLDATVRVDPDHDGADTAEGDSDTAEVRSPWWEWAAMVSQVGLGVVGGATLWLICEWLWQRIPVVALVVALGLITAMVWIVRRVRRAEDLQTTVIAVLVGLFVTVSPAALLLVNR